MDTKANNKEEFISFNQEFFKTQVSEFVRDTVEKTLNDLTRCRGRETSQCQTIGKRIGKVKDLVLILATSKQNRKKLN